MEIRLRMKVAPDSSDAILVNYLQNEEVTPYPYRMMVMLALKTYWLPLAYKHHGASVEEVERLTRDAIYRLRLHLKYLQEAIGLEASEIEVPGTDDLGPAVPASSPGPVESHASTTCVVSPGVESAEALGESSAQASGTGILESSPMEWPLQFDASLL